MEWNVLDLGSIISQYCYSRFMTINDGIDTDKAYSEDTGSV